MSSDSEMMSNMYSLNHTEQVGLFSYFVGLTRCTKKSDYYFMLLYFIQTKKDAITGLIASNA